MHELFEVVRRTLGARDVRFAADGEAGPGWVVVPLPSGGFLAAELEAANADLDAARARLEALVASFPGAVSQGRAEAAERPDPAKRLHELLVDLAGRARAIDAVIIDATAPIVWGTAFAAAEALEPAAEIVHVDWKTHRRTEPPPAPDAPWPLQRRAVRDVRALPQIPELPRGGHLARDARDPQFGWIARSFAGVYVAVLVFDHAWDELAAKPALAHALPAIEAALLSLPPRDPAGGAAALRSRR